MIILKCGLLGEDFTCSVTPTIFPDGTSQIWNLPDEAMLSTELLIDWRFEDEREIIDLVSLVMLLREENGQATLGMYVPFLCFGRQDKKISNSSCFNLHAFAKIINSLDLDYIATLDPHSVVAEKTIKRLSAADSILLDFHSEVLNKVRPTHILFPDAGAHLRYLESLDFCKDWPVQPVVLVGDKVRDPSTGKITSYQIRMTYGQTEIDTESMVLILDDIIDGGATFILAAKALREIQPYIQVHLCATHGIFSGGVDVLLNGGINAIYTTDSYIKNWKYHNQISIRDV